MTSIPRQNDVLFGRGAAINSHEGNKRFRSMVEKHKPTFAQTARAEKRDIAASIINEIQLNGGSFLMEDPNSPSREGSAPASSGLGNIVGGQNDLVTDPFILDKVWVPVGGDKVMDKVMHRLRESRINVSKKRSLPEQGKQRPADTKKSSGKGGGALEGRGSHSEAPEDFLAGNQRVGTGMHINIPGSADSFARAPSSMSNNIQELFKVGGLSQNMPTMHGLAQAQGFGQAPMPNNIQEQFIYGGGQRRSTMDGFAQAPDNIPSNIQDLLKAKSMSQNVPVLDSLTQAQSIVPRNIQDLLKAGAVSQHNPLLDSFSHAKNQVPANIQDLLEIDVASQRRSTIDSFARGANNIMPSNIQQVLMAGARAPSNLRSDIQGVLQSEGVSQMRPVGDCFAQAQNNLSSNIQELLKAEGVSQMRSAVDSLANAQKSMPSNIQELFIANGMSQNRSAEASFLQTHNNMSINIEEMLRAQVASRNSSAVDGYAQASNNIQGLFKSNVENLAQASKDLPDTVQELMKANGSSQRTSLLVAGSAMPKYESQELFRAEGRSIAGRGCMAPPDMPKETQELFKAGTASQISSSDDSFVRAPDPAVNLQLKPPAKSDSGDNLALSPAAPSVPISVQSWIRTTVGISLSSDDYLFSAINLSWLLTKQLLQMVAASEITSLADISIEKVVVHVTPPTKLQSASSLSIKVIEFQPLVSSTMTTMSQLDHSERSSRSICAALGNILLEVFSKGQSAGLSTASSSNLSHFTQPTTVAAGSLALAPSSQKRRISAPIGGSITSMVNRLLLEVGMPLSVRQLVCDSLNAVNEPCSKLAVSTLEEVLMDLTRMKDDPQNFLCDRMSPQQALDGTCLFPNGEKSHLFGREAEMEALMAAKKNVFVHVCMEDEAMISDEEESEENSSSGQGENHFLCESVFLSGYAGAGKSSLLQPLINECNRDWFVLHCKFDKLATPIKVLARSLDEFFSKWGPSKNNIQRELDPAMKKAFGQVCHTILSTIDNEGFSQLFELIPSLSQVFPEVASAMKSNSHGQATCTSSIDKVGSASKRRMYLFHVLFASICSAGYPVLVVADDLQWSDRSTVESLEDFIINYVHNSSNIWRESFRPGMLLVGAFRSNEVQNRDDITQIANSFEQSNNVKFTKLDIGELQKSDINKLLSDTLCLPMRYTQELAGLVLSKTRGNPFFIMEFLKSIIRAKLLEFSVSSRCWVWDVDVIDMHMISDGVAQLLNARFNQLPYPLIHTARVVSCFGSQVDDSTIDILSNDGHQLLPFNMQEALLQLSYEGLIEKAGPIHQFTHDLVQQSIYESIASDERKLLHKTIGTILLKSSRNIATIHLLAVDQLNIYCKDAVLSAEERAHTASINTTAARFAIAEYNLEGARTYIDAGMSVLDENRWENNYALSLKLYEMSATLSCMNGDIGLMYGTLAEVIANVKSFDESLTSSALLAKALAASSKYEDAISNCLSVLSNLGEDFPEDINLSLVLSELSVIQTTLANITVQQVKLLPPMMNKSKLHAMNFLSMLCMFCIQSKPMLVPILSNRMVRLTIEEGFCDDSIVGLVTAGYGLFSFTDNIMLSYRIGKVGESLIEENSNMHALRSRLCFELDSTLKAVVEPMQSAVANCPDRYDSALMTGDVDSAMLSLLAHCIGSQHIGMNLSKLTKSYVTCIKQSTKYSIKFVQYLAMSSFGTCIYLSGKSDHGLHVKSYEELNEIGRQTNQVNLLYQNFFNALSRHFWMRDYTKVAELGEKHKPTGHKRILEVIRTFFEGIACVTVARQTGQPNWRKTGEEALAKMLKWEEISSWNFQNMAKLLQAELHYLKGDLVSADLFYNESIESAREHKFIHYEALAYELYSMFLIENKATVKGVEQLKISLARYTEWGADRKVKDLASFMELVQTANHTLDLWS